MLSRVADSIYWMSRYIERAENVARFVDVNLRLMLDLPGGSVQQWQPLVDITGDTEPFATRYGEATQRNVIQFLTFDTDNVNSILSCFRAARENARSVREIISSEMWEQLNESYLMVSAAAGSSYPTDSQDLFASVKSASQMFAGVTDATMTHGEGWHFCRLGRKLERADKTSRILDVKYFLLLPAVHDVGTTVDDVQWAAVLRSASAFEMYRKKHGRIAPSRIGQFLLLDREFPRAIHYCLIAARESVHAISGTPAGMFRSPVEQLLGLLCSELAYAQIDDIIAAGLHEYLDELQTRMNLVGHHIHETFFRRAGGGASPQKAQAAHQNGSVLVGSHGHSRRPVSPDPVSL
jgi:uncharacterized alpha-E superfamily protein